MNSDLLVALAGGAIGAALAGLGFVAVRLSAVPAEVDRHDRRSVALDEDLERWVADDHRKLTQELNKIVNEHAGRGLLYSGVLMAALAEAKTRALQRYRDRRAETERVRRPGRGGVLAARRLAQAHAAPILWRYAPRRVEPVIEEWRKPVKRYGMGPAAIYDPTTWTTEDLLRDVRERPLEPPTDQEPHGAEPEEGEPPNA